MGITRTAVLTILLCSIQPAAAQTLGPAADAATAAVPTPELPRQPPRRTAAPAGSATVCVGDGGQVNVRAGASASSKVLGTLRNGEPVRVAGGGRWRRVVMSNGAAGYVSSRFVCR